MTTLLEPVIDETIDDEGDHDGDQILCHLYRHFLIQGRHAMCGIPASEDRHNAAHSEMPDQARVFRKGMLSCPICGVPICMDCLLKAS